MIEYDRIPYSTQYIQTSTVYPVRLFQLKLETSAYCGHTKLPYTKTGNEECGGEL